MKFSVIAIASLAFIGAMPTKADVVIDGYEQSQIQQSLLEKVKLLEAQNSNLKKEIQEIRAIIKNSSIAIFPEENPEGPLVTSVTAKAYIAKPSFESSQIFAIKENSPNDSTFGSAYVAEIDYSAGIQTSLAIDLPNSNWGTSLSWTSLNASSESVCTDTGNECYGTFSHADDGLETGASGQSIEGVNSFDYDDVNLIAIYDPKDAGAIDWSYSIGLKYASVDKSLIARMYPYDSSNNSGRSEERSYYSGIGPVAGIQASTNLFNSGIRAYAGVRAGMLNSTLSATFEQDEDLYSPGYFCDASGGNDDCYNTSVEDTSWNPYLGASLGLEYLWKISDSFGINFSGSYEFDQYVKAVGKMKFPDDVNEGYVITSYEDMSLSGFAAGITATYMF